MWNLEQTSGDIEIKQPDWIPFLDSFSRQHEDWMATIEVTTVRGKAVEAKDLRLRGVSIDHAQRNRRIYVEVGNAPYECLTHVVDAPTRLRFKRTPSGEHQGLEIVSANGSATCIRFRAAVLPEMLDGVLR